eukprot:GHVN01030404.1.p1 GENE.GHVN01030404.1~~GHVN01030404.1.p1  ORF type:complete len:415 (+),score=31.90 GHVN01030404.1:1039-2283(+)
MPQFSKLEIGQILKKHNNDKEAALDEMIMTDISKTQGTNEQYVPSTAPVATGPSYSQVWEHATVAPIPQGHYGLVTAPQASFHYYHPPPGKICREHWYRWGTGCRKALLIGINYKGTRAELQGCIHDVARIRFLIYHLYGFRDVVCLTDDSQVEHFKPTKANITKAMQWLLAGSRAGDSFIFHYSGHGGQVRDTTGFEEDGMDETILPVDFQQAGQLTDDELHHYLVQKLPTGARLTAIMDCCNSGTGMDLPYVLTKSGAWEKDGSPFYTTNDAVLIAGCNDGATSADVRGGKGTHAGGALTTAFVKVLTKYPYNLTFSLMKDHVNYEVGKLCGMRRGRQQTQISSTQQFDMSKRPFNFTQAIPNSNAYYGREHRRKKAKPHQGGFERGGMAGPAVGLGFGVLGGVLLAAALSD